MISIIIPTYNTAKYLSEALDSALGSNGNDYEIIIVDDGSIDNTEEVVKSYLSKSCVKYIKQKNKGLAGARNTGIKAATGKYLVFLDSDDIILPEKLYMQSDFLDKHQEFDAVYSKSIFFIDGDDSETIPTNFPCYSGNILKNLIFGNFIHVNSIMVHKDKVLETGLFDENLRELEDWDLWLRMCLKGSQFAYMDQILSKVRLRKSSMTSDQIKMFKTMVRVLNKFINSLKNYPTLKKELISEAYYALNLYKIKAGERKNFFRELFSALRKNYIRAPLAAKLSIKFSLSYFYNPVDQTTKELSKYWKNA